MKLKRKLHLFFAQRYTAYLTEPLHEILRCLQEAGDLSNKDMDGDA